MDSKALFIKFLSIFSSNISIYYTWCLWHFPKFLKWVLCLFNSIAGSAVWLLCALPSPQFCLVLIVMRSAAFVSPGSWLFFSRWSSCGVSEVSSLPSAPLPSCVPNVGSVSWRESVCQVDYFHLIKPAPLPLLSLRLSFRVIHTQRESSSCHFSSAYSLLQTLSPRNRATIRCSQTPLACLNTCNIYDLILMQRTEHVPL